jgi:hypothetical protein
MNATKTKSSPRPKVKKSTFIATPRQKLAAQLRAQNPKATDKQIMIEAGYSPIVPVTQVTESKGYKEAIRAYGLTEHLITSALVEDIEKKPQRRVQELTLAADILNMRKREEVSHNTVNIALFSTEQQEKIAQRILQSIKPIE